MATNRLLDVSYRAATFIGLALLCSCGLPRLIIIHDPLTPQEHLELGMAYEHRAEFEAALREYNAASKTLPVAHLYIGNVRYQRQEYTKAESAYRRAIETTDDPRAYNNLAWLYYTRNVHLPEALELARQAVQRDPLSNDFNDTLEKIRHKIEAEPSPE